MSVSVYICFHGLIDSNWFAIKWNKRKKKKSKEEEQQGNGTEELVRTEAEWWGGEGKSMRIEIVWINYIDLFMTIVTLVCRNFFVFVFKDLPHYEQYKLIDVN